MRYKKITRRTAIKEGLTGIAAITASGIFPGILKAANSEITYWHHFAAEYGQRGMAITQKMLLDKYGIKVLPDTIPNKDYMLKVSGASLTGSLPDTGMVTTARFGDLRRLNAVQPVTDLVNNWELVKNGTVDKKVFDDVTGSNGEIYGTPAFSFVSWVYYRKDWFAEAGLKPPTTWDEFVNAAVKLTDRAKGRYGFGMRGGGGGHGHMIQMLERWGAFKFDNKTGYLDVAKATEAIQVYTDLHTKLKVTPSSTPQNSFRQLTEGFKTGLFAMWWHHTGSYIDMKKAQGDNVGTLQDILGPEGRKQHTSILFNGIFNNRNRDASFKWISWWAETEPAVAFLKETGYLAPSKAIAGHPDVVNNPDYGAALAAMAEETPGPGFPGFSAWGSGPVLKEMQKVLIGNATPTQAAEAMARGLDKLTKK